MAQKEHESPVLLHKQQGQKMVDGKRDFVLAIQTSQQADIKFGHDATHGANGYDFSLITLIVVDDFGEGYPVAWCLSNRTDFLNRYQEESILCQMMLQINSILHGLVCSEWGQKSFYVHGM